MELLFHDFEVFKYDVFLVVINPRTGEKWRIHNDSAAIMDFYLAHRKDVLVGYNCNNYDQYVLKAILCGLDPYDLTQFIIAKGRHGWEYSDLFKKYHVNTYDTMFTPYPLKALEGSLGLSIVESSIAWDLDRPMTDEEIEETFEYCTHDVECSIEVFLKENANFNVYMNLIKKFKLPMSYLGKTKAQLAAEILGAVRIERGDEWDIKYVPQINVTKYTEVLDWFHNKDNLWLTKYRNGKEEENPGITVNVGGLDMTFGMGGGHSSKVKYREKGNFLILDAKSYYPSMMIVFDFLSRNVQNKSRFIESKKERVAIKGTNPKLADALKVYLNTVYGAMGREFNKLYDPQNAHNTCINGQLLLLDLAEKVENLGEIINVNTDGIIIKTSRDVDVRKVSDEWATRTGMDLEYQTFDEIIMKDVNNYIMIKDGKAIKRVGGYVKKSTPLDNNLKIVKDGVVEYLVNGILPENWIATHDELIDYQTLVRVGKTYDYTMHNGQKLIGRTFRVFASKNPDDGKLSKVKILPTKISYTNVGNSPDHSFICNEDIRGKKVPPQLDKAYYVNMIYERASAFLE